MKIPITDIQPDQWYNVKDTVLLYERAIANVNGGLSLKVAGARIMPMAFNVLFLSDHRGADAGHFKAIEMTATSAVLEDTSLHLPDFHLGVLEGAVGIFPGCSLISGETVKRGSDKKVYKITWQKKPGFPARGTPLATEKHL
jgi:hypothetical protein